MASVYGAGRDPGTPRGIWLFLPAVIISAVVIVGAALWIQAEQVDDEQEPAPISATVFARDPASYVGDQISLAGRVSEVFTDRVFTIASGPTLVVLGRDTELDPPLQLVPGDAVVVDATVLRFGTSEFSERIDPTDLPAGLDEFAGDVAMIATTIAIAPDPTPDVPPALGGGSRR